MSTPERPWFRRDTSAGRNDSDGLDPSSAVNVPSPRAGDHDRWAAPAEPFASSRERKDGPDTLKVALGEEPGPATRPMIIGGVVLTLAVVIFLALRLVDRNDAGPPAVSAAADIGWFDSPQPLTPGTGYVRTEVLPSGDLRVDHWVRTRSLISDVWLAPPRVAGLDPGLVRATSIAVQADGYAVSGGTRLHGDSLHFFVGGAERVRVGYVLSGVTEGRGSGKRLLARVTSLDLTYTGSPVQTTHAVRGADVLALSCTANAASASPRPCGAPRDGIWTVDLDREELVAAQFDLY